MPGYEANRFVDLSENDKAELICIICQDILCSPMVAQCCQQSFCEDCINYWLKDNNSCPYDRKAMTLSGLSRPPRFMLNALGRLKIHCDFKENGCKEVLLLANLSQHTGKCRYNIEICKKCLCEIQDKSSHDCIETLLELNRKANEKIETLERNASAKSNSPIEASTSAQVANISLREQSLQKQIRELNAEKLNHLIRMRELGEEKVTFLKTIQELQTQQMNSLITIREFTEEKQNSVDTTLELETEKLDLLKTIQEMNAEKQNFLKQILELREEKENFIKTIEDLSNDSELKTNLSSNNFLDIFNEARKQLWNPEMINNVMNAEITQKVLSIVKNELDQDNNSGFVVCKNVVDKLNTEFGSLWQCIVSQENSLESCCTYEDGYLITFKNAEVYYKIYKSKFIFEIEEFIARYRSGKIKREIQILDTDMNENMIANVKRFTFKTIEKSNRFVEIASGLVKEMEKIYRGKWQCFLFGYLFGTYSIRKISGTYIEFDLENLRFTLFQPLTVLFA